jgi:hypothetical protein
VATLRDSLLPALDQIRAIPAIMGLRPHIVGITVRVWTGERPGIGTYTPTSTKTKLDLGAYNIKVRNVSQQEAIASAGLYTNQDLVCGPITPPYTGSILDNNNISVFDPPVGGSPTEVFFSIVGPGYSANGDWFKKIAQRTDQPFRYMFWLRKTGETP